MKNLFVLIIAIFVFSGFTANAQKEGFRVGVKAGVNFANIYDEKGEDFVADGKIGLATGVFFSIPIGDILGFQPELMYSQKGFDGSGSLLGLKYEFTRTTSYLDIPLQLQIKPATSFAIVVGPQISWLLSTKDVFGDGEITVLQEEEITNENFRKSILGLVAGFDVKFSNFVISARVARDMMTNNEDGETNSPRYKNQWLQATAGLVF